MSLPAVAQPEDLIEFVCDDILPETRACVEVPNDDNIRRVASRCILAEDLASYPEEYLQYFRVCRRRLYVCVLARW